MELERVSSNGEVSASGTWQFQENNFTGKYTFLSGTIVNISGTVSKLSNSISGTWKIAVTNRVPGMFPENIFYQSLINLKK